MRQENESLPGTADDELRCPGFRHRVWMRTAAAAWERGGPGPGDRPMAELFGVRR